MMKDDGINILRISVSYAFDDSLFSTSQTIFVTFLNVLHAMHALLPRSLSFVKILATPPLATSATPGLFDKINLLRKDLVKILRMLTKLNNLLMKVNALAVQNIHKTIHLIQELLLGLLHIINALVDDSNLRFLTKNGFSATLPLASSSVVFL